MQHWQLPSASSSATGDPSLQVIYWTSPVYNLSCITVCRKIQRDKKRGLSRVYRKSSQEEFDCYWIKKTNSSRLTSKQGIHSIFFTWKNKKGKRRKKNQTKTHTHKKPNPHKNKPNTKWGRWITLTYLSTSIATSKIVSKHLTHTNGLFFTMLLWCKEVL